MQKLSNAVSRQSRRRGTFTKTYFAQVQQTIERIDAEALEHCLTPIAQMCDRLYEIAPPAGMRSLREFPASQKVAR